MRLPIDVVGRMASPLIAPHNTRMNEVYPERFRYKLILVAGREIPVDRERFFRELRMMTYTTNGIVGFRKYNRKNKITCVLEIQ